MCQEGFNALCNYLILCSVFVSSDLCKINVIIAFAIGYVDFKYSLNFQTSSLNFLILVCKLTKPCIVLVMLGDNVGC